jgi:hypothetical protein
VFSDQCLVCSVKDLVFSVECLVCRVQGSGLWASPNRLGSDERRHGHRASGSIRRQLHLFRGLGSGLGLGLGLSFGPGFKIWGLG